MVTARSKKIPNWKAPCPDGVQGYCIKKLTALHEQKADHMNDLINNRVIILVWMTTGRTLLCQKKPRKRKVGDSNVVNISEAVDPKEYKVNEVKETENEWKQKRMHGHYVREKEVDWDRTWQWITKGDLKGCTE
ncbi:unnamed protein product [Porites lobata]|uniref:Uncharacterized protein n=1 Tax=Porites lobata TaxID=104759 RepID=A0ABN8NRT8_9CNID|nr:unnamed protein product [Porites lobata]